MLSDGYWGNYTAWTDCSVTCGSGYQYRSRPCINPSPSLGEAYCPGLAEDIFLTVQPPCADPNNGMWMGLTDKISEGSFIWESTQKALTYTAWTPGMPDNAYGVQDCVHMWCLNNNGEWDDDYCDDSDQSALCEVPIPCLDPRSKKTFL